MDNASFVEIRYTFDQRSKRPERCDKISTEKSGVFRDITGSKNV